MKKTTVKIALSFILCMMLIAAAALMTTGCNGNKPETATDVSQTADAVNTHDITLLGQGATTVYVDVVDKQGSTTKFEVKTDKKTVGEALQEVGLVEGEEGPFGLYIKKVNGITADYDVDQTYWAFYINGEMAPTGADATDLVAGTTYMFKVEK